MKNTFEPANELHTVKYIILIIWKIWLLLWVEKIEWKNVKNDKFIFDG